ncbi:hypothetical protein U9R90_28895 [Streptomyces sp. E11-3]|uniref:hypothetical protein n=1 Tax=Streptomyces sp. E11-3 TaxID=3110112 RepID=UPI00397FC79E
MLIPETSGRTTLKLPEFTPDQEVYTYYASCTGEARVEIVYRGDADPDSVACDGVPTIGLVHTEIRPHQLTVRVTGGTAAWRLAVVSGDHLT